MREEKEEGSRVERSLVRKSREHISCRHVPSLTRRDLTFFRHVTSLLSSLT